MRFHLWSFLIGAVVTFLVLRLMQGRKITAGG